MDKWFQNMFSFSNDRNDGGSSNIGSLPEGFLNFGDSNSQTFFDGLRNPEGDSSKNSPRDSMLKDNETKSNLRDSINDPPIIYSHEEDLKNPNFFGNNFLFKERDNDGILNPHGKEDHDHSSQFSFSFGMMGSIIDEMMRSFEDFGRLDQDPFENFDNSSPGSHQLPDQERKDLDLDSNEDNARLLLKEEPGYSGTPGNSVAPNNGLFSHSFKSTSIVRIRKPDGTMEETKKYTDSTGVEKITVTTSEPQQGNDQLVLKDENQNFARLPQNPFSLFSFFR